MKFVKFFAIIVTIFSSIYCYAATKTEKQMVELKYEVKKNKPKQQSSASSQKRKKKAAAQPAIQYNCKVSIEPFVDSRINQQTLGASWSKPLITNDVPNWLESIRNDDLIAKTKNWSGAKSIVLKPKLKKLYSYAESMNIHGVISLEIEYWIDGKLDKTNYYRGMGSKANMMNALNEYGVALNYGVHEIVPRVITDTKVFCTN